MRKYFKQKNRGFTLLEALVAISIFTVSILALFSILASGVSSTNYAKRKIIATYLAQEGIEYMRNIRDTYVLYDNGNAQAGWNKFRNRFGSSLGGGVSCHEGTNGCYFNDQRQNNPQKTLFDMFNPSSQPQPITKILFETCPSGVCPPLLYDSATGKYGYESGVDSSFRRKIRVDRVIVSGTVNEVKILSSVSWTQGSGSQTVTFSESLFNWIE